MAAFNDALDLRTAVVEAVGDATIADVWPRLVALAEGRLNRALRTRHQLKTVAYASAVPVDFLEMAALTQGGRRYYWTPGDTIPPGYQMDYYAALPTLADSLTATNWLLVTNPDLYLYAAAAEAARYLQDMDKVQAFEAARDEALRGARAEDERARFGQAVVRFRGHTP